METKEMKQYTGTKTVKAMPMTLGEAEHTLNRHIDIAAVEYRSQVPGYLVEYGEDGDNYRSWSPKDVFERAYRPSETHLDRMLIEYGQLKDRIMKLQAFVLNSTIETRPPYVTPSGLKFDYAYDEILHKQLRHMQQYARDLSWRILNKRVISELEERAIECHREMLKAAETKRQSLQSLVGMTVVEAGRCDSCPSEPTTCKKLQLADGSYICLKDYTKEDCGCAPRPPRQEEDANTQDLAGGGPRPVHNQDDDNEPQPFC